MSNQTPLTKTQKIEKVRHLLVLFENLRNAEKDFRSSCQIIAKQLDIHQSLLRKAVELEHKNALNKELMALENKTDAFDEMHSLFVDMYVEQDSERQ